MFEDVQFKIYFMIIIFVLITSFVYYVFTRFSDKVIVIDDNKIFKSSGKRTSNLVSDTEGNLYKVTNSWIILHFNSAEVLNTLKPGQKFKVSGYGVRFPVLGMYPIITSATLQP